VDESMAGPPEALQLNAIALKDSYQAARPSSECDGAWHSGDSASDYRHMVARPNAFQLRQRPAQMTIEMSLLEKNVAE